MPCTFCNPSLREAARIDVGLFWAQFDIHPVSPGHLLIIPERHIERLSQLTVEEWRVFQQIQKLAIDYIESLKGHEWRSAYEKILGARVTENSVWFINQTLTHPRFGTKPDGYNHIVNEGEVAGQTVMHLHWHVIPRYKGDVRDPSGGGRYVIPKMGNYKRPRVSAANAEKWGAPWVNNPNYGTANT